MAGRQPFGLRRKSDCPTPGRFGSVCFKEQGFAPTTEQPPAPVLPLINVLSRDIGADDAYLGIYCNDKLG